MTPPVRRGGKDAVTLPQTNAIFRGCISTVEEGGPLLYQTTREPSLSTTYVPPAAETEERLARVQQELLGIAAIGIRDDCSELEGDSLIGTQLIIRVKATFGVRLLTTSVYGHPTIQTMSRAIEKALISHSNSQKVDESLSKVEGLK